MEIVITYELYNDGWQFTDATIEKYNFVSLVEVSEELIQRYLPEGAEIENMASDLSGCYTEVLYRYSESYMYCEVEYEQIIGFRQGNPFYDDCPSDLWLFDEKIDVSCNEIWDISGTWECEGYAPTMFGNRPFSATLSVESFGPLIRFLDEEYRMTNASGFYLEGSFSSYTDSVGYSTYSENKGPFEVQYRSADNAYVFNPTGVSPATRSIYISYDGIVLSMWGGETVEYEMIRVS